MPFPKSDQRNAYETFVLTVKNDPVLKKELNTFLAWGGTVKDAEVPSTANLPYLSLTYVNGGVQTTRLDTCGTAQADIAVQVVAAVAGQNEGDLIDLWDAVVRAIYPRTQHAADVIDARLKGVGIAGVEFVQPAIQAQGTTEDGVFLQATGLINLQFYYSLAPLS